MRNHSIWRWSTNDYESTYITGFKKRKYDEIQVTFLLLCARYEDLDRIELPAILEIRRLDSIDVSFIMKVLTLYRCHSHCTALHHAMRSFLQRNLSYPKEHERRPRSGSTPEKPETAMKEIKMPKPFSL